MSHLAHDPERPRDDRALDNFVAVGISVMFHPFVIFIPALVLLLRDVPRSESVRWLVFVSLCIIIPTAMMARYIMRQQQRQLYQRRARAPIYITFFLSALVCWLVLLLGEAPRPMIAPLLAMVIWTPVQAVINEKWTKISAHSGVAAAVFMGVGLGGALPTLWWQLLAAGCVLAVGWARYVSCNHSPMQIALGCAVGAGSVTIAYVLMGEA